MGQWPVSSPLSRIPTTALDRGLSPRQRVLASSICESVLSLSFRSLPEHLLCFMLAPGTRILRQAISHHRTLTWGVIALGHSGHIEEVSTETSQGDWSGVWGGSGCSPDSPDCCPCSWSRLPSWTPPGTTLLASTLMVSSPPELLSTCAQRARASPLFSQASAHI